MGGRGSNDGCVPKEVVHSKSHHLCHHHRLPSLFSLSGQIKGKTGCIVCIDGTCYTYLSASKKMVYMRHK
jgi:hypothetical protein